MKEYWNSLPAGKKVRIISTFIFCLMLIIFAFQNWESKELKLVFVSVQIPITLLILISMFAGYAIAIIFNLKKIMAKDKEIKELQSKLKDQL